MVGFESKNKVMSERFNNNNAELNKKKFME